jgi:DNA-binding GntR family transcriptional regulator
MHKRPLQQLPRLPLRDRVHASLLDAIVAGELPPGLRLRDTELAAELGVSRTPVREALQRLEDEGLVQTFPGALTRVAPLDARDAREAVPVIAALHAVATREAVPRLTESDLEQLRGANAAFTAALAATDVRAALAADDDFHNCFLRIAANAELQRTLDRLMPRVRRLELARFNAVLGRNSARQHEEIIAAAARGEARATAELVEENWLGLGRLLVQTFETTGEEERGHGEPGDGDGTTSRSA